MSCVRFVLAAIVLVLTAASALGQENNNCMDCLQRQIRHETPEGIWYESDGFCCMAPCAGYAGYEMKEPTAASVVSRRK